MSQKIFEASDRYSPMPLQAVGGASGNLGCLLDSEIAYLHQFDCLTLTRWKGSQCGLHLLNVFSPLQLSWRLRCVLRWQAIGFVAKLLRLSSGGGTLLLTQNILHDAPEQLAEGRVERTIAPSGPCARKCLLGQIVQPVARDTSTCQETYDAGKVSLVKMLELRNRVCVGMV